MIDRSSRGALAGISVALTGRSPVLTDEAGRFRFTNATPGRYLLATQGVGYVPTDTVLLVFSDTSLVIELEAAPVPLDTLHVRVRDVEVKGTVHELTSGAWVNDAEVFATPDLEKTTDPIGRFKLGKVPTGVPLTIRVQSFGYLPKTISFVPQRDTTIAFELEHDPVVQRMIAAQVQRIDERSGDRRYERLPTLDRDELLEERNWPLSEVLKRRLGEWRTRPISCVVIDENELMAKWRFRWIMPDEVHRVEVIEAPGPRRSLMVRIYTRDFVRDMVLGKKELLPEDIAMTRMAGRCR